MGPDHRRTPGPVLVDTATLNLYVSPGRGHVAEIGYMLGQRFEGHGIITRAVIAVLDAAIDRLDLQRFEIRCAPDNQRSRAIPQRLGFHEEGLLRGSAQLDGRYHDEILYALLAEEWIAARSQQ